MDYKKITRAILANTKMPINFKISNLKQRVSANDYKEALKMHPAFLMHLRQNTLFKNIESIALRDPYEFTGDFKKEFKWTTLFLENYTTKINDFLLLKNKFEKEFFLADYKSAKDTLILVEENFGISLWTIEAHLMIEEYTNGTESNWEKLSHYLDTIKNPFYEFIISSNSKRIESDLPFAGYQNQFQNDIDNIQTADFIKGFFVFKCFSLAAFDHDSKLLEGIIYLSNIFTPIDQYLILVDALVSIVSTSKDADKSILQFIKPLKGVITNDIKIRNLYNILNQNGELISDGGAGSIECLDAYYKGDFVLAEQISKTEIANSPCEFEYYEIYCKSLINLDMGFIPSEISPFIDSILESLYYTLTFKNKYASDRGKLAKLSLVLMNTNFGKQAYSLLSEIENSQPRNYTIPALSSSIISPKNLLITERAEEINKNFDSLLANHCFKVYKYKSGQDQHFTGKLSYSLQQESIYKAINLFNNKDYRSTISNLQDSPSLDLNYYYYERKVFLLLSSYLQLNLIEDALKLFGTIYFNESFATSKLNDVGILNKIKSVGFLKFSNYIELPILYSLSAKEYDLYEVFDEFMAARDIINIQDLDIQEFIQEFSFAKAIYFFEKVLTISTLKYSTDYGSISDVEEERVFILNTLIEVNPVEKLNYEKEINEIYRINSVRKVLKEVDEGRLYIDVKNLKELQIATFNDVFKRFKDIEFSSSTKQLIGFNASSPRNWEVDKQEKSESKDSYNDAGYLAFKNMYLISRDNFLFSKEYGLDSCLSTRIRHGALKNHIRSVFEKLDLVTPRLDNEYTDNRVWASQLRNQPELNSLVQDRLKAFSSEIDKYTAYIVDNLIQIQTEKNTDKPDGLFKYFSGDEILYTFYTQNKYLLNSIEFTVDRILSTLINYTLIDLLRDISDVFTSAIPNRYQNIIENLLTELRELHGINNCDLIPNLIKSSTDIQSELEYISEWFYLSTTSPSSLLPVDIILNASVELTNKINPLFNLSPKITIKNDAAGFNNLIFVFNIMLNNVIHHSKLTNEQIDLSIEVGLAHNDMYVYVKFTNNINPDYDYTFNKSKLALVKSEWNDHSKIERSNKEGESGFDKIKRILLYEALAKTDLFDYELDKDSISITLFFPYTKPEQDISKDHE